MTNIEKYGQIMLCIKHRIHHILTMEHRNADLVITADESIHTYWDIELEEKALQIRKIIELIAAASLEIYGIANENRPKLSYIFRQIKDGNLPYPEPVKKQIPSSNILIRPNLLIPTRKGLAASIPKVKLDESLYPSPQRLSRIWGDASDLLHSNPADGTDYETIMKHKNEINDWTQQIINLLDNHYIRCPSKSEEYLFYLHFDEIEEKLGRIGFGGPFQTQLEYP